MSEHETLIVGFAPRFEGPFTSSDNRWSRAQQGRTLCPSCLRLKRSMYPEAFDVVLAQLPAGTSYAGVFYGGAAVISSSLLEVLAPLLDRFAIGRCLDSSGEKIAGYRTIYTDAVVALRIVPAGRPQLERCNQCQVCGSWMVSSEFQYVLRRELPPGVLWQDNISGLYIAGSHADGVPWKQFPDLLPRRIPIREQKIPGDPCPWDIGGPPTDRS